MTEIEIHDFDERLQSTVESIQESREISEENKELAEEYLKWLKLGNKRSDGRLFKYMTCLKKILENNDVNFQELEDSEKWKETIQDILIDIQESRYYHSEWAASTKEDYYKVVLDLIEFNDVSSNPKETSLIPSDFSAYGNRGKGDDDQHTDPGDIPTPEEAKKFMRKIEENGKPVISLRNTALLAFLWDTGARIGEALQTQLKHVEVKNGKVWVEVQGNKSSDDRKVRIFQGAQTLKDWYSNGHPVSTPAQRGEAYLFPVMWPETDVSKPVGYRTVTEKIFKKAFRRLKKSGEVSCDISGEPNHIWRKAMTTFYRVNEWAGYDKILKRQGKSISNPTLPEYLRLMQSDVDATIAENAGVEHDEDDKFSHETARSMKNGDLLPKKCRECGEINRCYKVTCGSCGTELPDEKVPEGHGIESEEEEREKAELEKIKAQIAELNQMAENMGVDFGEIKKET